MTMLYTFKAVDVFGELIDKISQNSFIAIFLIIFSLVFLIAAIMIRSSGSDTYVLPLAAFTFCFFMGLLKGVSSFCYVDYNSYKCACELDRIAETSGIEGIENYVEISAVIYPSTSSVYATTAETVTVKQPIIVTRRDDVNRDGSVTAEDAMLLVKILDGIKTFNDNAFEANADANDDSDVNMLDVVSILNIVDEETTVETSTEITTVAVTATETATEETTETTTAAATEAIVYGDVNGNGVVEIMDVSNLYDMVSSGSAEYINGITDVTCDGKVDTTDVATLLQKILNSIWLMPCEEISTEITTVAVTTTETVTEATTEAVTASETSTGVTTEAVTATETATEETTVTTTAATTTEGTTAESTNSSDITLSDEEIEALEGVIYDTKYVLIYKVKTSAEKELVQYILDAMESYLADNSYDVTSAMQEAKVMYKALSNEEQDDFYSCVLAVYDMMEITTLWDIFSILL